MDNTLLALITLGLIFLICYCILPQRSDSIYIKEKWDPFKGVKKAARKTKSALRKTQKAAKSIFENLQ